MTGGPRDRGGGRINPLAFDVLDLPYRGGFAWIWQSKWSVLTAFHLKNRQHQKGWTTVLNLNTQCPFQDSASQSRRLFVMYSLVCVCDLSFSLKQETTLTTYWETHLNNYKDISVWPQTPFDLAPQNLWHHQRFLVTHLIGSSWWRFQRIQLGVVLARQWG